MDLPRVDAGLRALQVLLVAFCFLFRPQAGLAQVISEFLAQNSGQLLDEDGDSPDWIEIHNTTTNLVNLRNWSLTDTPTNLTKWLFPDTPLPAGAYLVVFASDKNRRVPGEPLHTNFKLSTTPDYLALVAPGGVEVVSEYAPAYPPQLPNISYGLRDLAGSVPVLASTAPARVLVPTDGLLGLDWVLLQFDDSAWLQGRNGVGYETSPADYAQLIRTDVRAPMSRNNSCYVRLPFVVDDPTAFTDWRLLVQYDDGFIAYLNGEEIVRRNAPDNAVWNSAATANHPDAEAVVPEEFSLRAVEDLIMHGTNVLALHGMNTSTSSSDFLILATVEARPLTSSSAVPVYFTLPTPGAANVGGVEALGPLILQVTHTPDVPEVGQDLLVQATVVPSFKPVASVELHYRVMFGSEEWVPMLDDGAHGDGAPGDGTYGATIPASRARAGEMIRYFITASDEAGAPSRLPLYLDPLESAQSFGTMVADPEVQSLLPVVHWFVQNPGAADTPTGTRCALFYLGEFYDNVLFSLRGQSSSGFPKKGYNLDFPRDHRFAYRTNAARVKDIKLLTNWADKSRVRNTLAYDMIQEAGSVGHFAFQVRVQRNAAFHAILDMMEDADDRWMERVGRDPNGALYKMYNSLNGTGGSEKKTRKHEDFSDLQALVNNLSESRPLATRVTYAYDNLDLPQTVSYFAALALISSQDHGHKNFYLYRDSDGSGEWAIFPWDIDLSWGRNWTDSGGYFTDTLYQDNVLNFYNLSQQNKPSNRLYNLMFTHPDFRRMYLRRLRTVMDRLLQPPGTPSDQLIIEARIQQMMDLMDPPQFATSDADLDFTKWGSWGNRNPMRPEAQRILNIHLPGRRSFLFNANPLLNGEAIPPSQPTNATVAIGALEFNPPSGNQDEEFIEVLNPNDYALDVSGWKLESAVQFTFKPGTVIPAGSRLYLSPNVSAFRARASAPRGGQGLFVQGNYTGQLSARGESLRLTDDTGRLVVETNYPGQPTLAQRFLHITELMFHPATPPADSAFAEGDFEFVELKNSGTEPLDLTGVRFTRGITFSFTGSAVTNLAPGEYVLVVRNPAAFASRYGPGLNVAGAYVGALDNAGETLRLEDAVGEVVFEFRYSPEWQPLADGPGYSLERIDLARSPDRQDNWRASALVGGSPGRDTVPASLVISRATLANGQFVITFKSEPSRTYTLLRCDDLVSHPWEPVQTVRSSSPADEIEIRIDLIPHSAGQFYRLRLEP